MPRRKGLINLFLRKKNNKKESRVRKSTEFSVGFQAESLNYMP